MSLYSKNTVANLIPCLCYRDLPAALEWLCAVFDFERRHVVEDEQAGILHAQLGFGSSLLMLGPVDDAREDRLLSQPDEVGGVATQGIYVIVTSADASIPRPRQPERRSSVSSKTKIMAVAASVAVIRRGICGVSVPMIPGPNHRTSVLLRPRAGNPVNRGPCAGAAGGCRAFFAGSHQTAHRPH